MVSLKQRKSISEAVNCSKPYLLELLPHAGFNHIHRHLKRFQSSLLSLAKRPDPIPVDCRFNQIIVSWKSSLVMLFSRSFLVRMQVRLVDCRFPGRLGFGPTRILGRLVDCRFPVRLRFGPTRILDHLADYRFPVRLRFGLTSMGLVLHCLYLHRFAHDQLPLSPSLRRQARLIEIVLERKYFSY
jgi:hypothetical protein